MALQDSGILELRGVSRRLPARDAGPEETLHATSLRVASQQLTWLTGPAGGGKELLFRLLSLSESPDAGEVLVAGRVVSGLDAAESAAGRARQFGFVGPAPFLLPTFSAIENIAVPLMKVSRPSLEEAQERIADLLRFVDLQEKAETPAASLSAPEQVRLVLARALANQPLVLFVEDLQELLSLEESLLFQELLRRSCRRYGVAVVALEGSVRLPCADDCVWEVVDGNLLMRQAESSPAVP